MYSQTGGSFPLSDPPRGSHTSGYVSDPPRGTYLMDSHTDTPEVPTLVDLSLTHPEVPTSWTHPLVALSLTRPGVPTLVYLSLIHPEVPTPVDLSLTHTEVPTHTGGAICDLPRDTSCSVPHKRKVHQFPSPIKLTRQTLYVAGAFDETITGTAWFVRAEGGKMIKQPDPIYACNAEETDTRLWLHVKKSLYTKVLVL